MDEWLLCKEPLLDFFYSDDSVKDKDYLSESSNTSLSEDEVQVTLPCKSRKRKQIKTSKPTKRAKTTKTNSNLETHTETITIVAKIHSSARISKKCEVCVEKKLERKKKFISIR